MIKVKKLTAYDLPSPAQSKWGDAGYDLRSAVERVVTLHPGDQKAIPTGFAWEIPINYVGFVKPRSGLAVKHRIDIRAGTVDSSFRGEVMAVLLNEGLEPFHILYGDRIAQMVVVPCMIGPVLTVDELGPSDRGGEGFGSTGNK